MYAKHTLKNLWNVVIISEIGFKETSLFKSHILVWNSFSTQRLVWLHGISTSRHAIPRLSISIAAHFFYKQSSVLCCSTFKFRWLSLVPCWISFTTPIHKIHSSLGCENHTTSKMMTFIKFRKNTKLCFGLKCYFQPPGIFFPFSPELLKNSMKIHWNT